ASITSTGTPVVDVLKRPPAAGTWLLKSTTTGPFAPAGPAWMWALVAFELRPVTFQLPLIVPAAASKVRITVPPPVVFTGGTWLEPSSLAPSAFDTTSGALAS